MTLSAVKVVASATPQPATPPSALAEDAGKRAYRLHGSPYEGIEPVDGWELHWLVDRDGDGFDYPEFFARGADRDVWLQVSRFDFDPTQLRFAWLVRSGFPCRHRGPWTNTNLDAAICASLPAILPAGDLRDEVEDALTASFDVDWKPAWGATAIIERLSGLGILRAAATGDGPCA